jgi:hypothetical protein
VDCRAVAAHQDLRCALAAGAVDVAHQQVARVVDLTEIVQSESLGNGLLAGQMGSRAADRQDFLRVAGRRGELDGCGKRGDQEGFGGTVHGGLLDWMELT